MSKISATIGRFSAWFYERQLDSANILILISTIKVLHIYFIKYIRCCFQFSLVDVLQSFPLYSYLFPVLTLQNKFPYISCYTIRNSPKFYFISSRFWRNILTKGTYSSENGIEAGHQPSYHNLPIYSQHSCIGAIMSLVFLFLRLSAT